MIKKVIEFLRRIFNRFDMVEELPDVDIQEEANELPENIIIEVEPDQVNTTIEPLKEEKPAKPKKKRGTRKKKEVEQA